MSRELVSVLVGEAMPSFPLDQCVDAVSEIAHEHAVEQYGAVADCQFLAFAKEEGEGVGNRADFEHAMRQCSQISEEAVEHHLHTWDSVDRPLAVIHFQPGPRLN